MAIFNQIQGGIMKKILAVALLSTVAVTPAFAADSGGYIGVTVGRAKMDNPYAGTVTKDNETVGGILAGYQYNKNLGVEVFYTSVGKLEVTGKSAKGDAIGLNVVGIAPLSDAFSLYAKLGYANTKADASGAATFTGERRSSVTGGVGAQYNMSKEISFRFGWDGYELRTSSLSGFPLISTATRACRADLIVSGVFT
ncbi:MAG: porin family protein [Nitrosomonadales bacterium]|nr:porin family protein [Nitrosomonadales bacterium]